MYHHNNVNICTLLIKLMHFNALSFIHYVIATQNYKGDTFIDQRKLQSVSKSLITMTLCF
jgi:hypothetical protein